MLGDDILNFYTIEMSGTVTLQSDLSVLTDRINTLEKSDQLTLDFSDVDFVNPEAMIILVTASRLAFEKTNRPIIWDALKSDVYSYLERVNITNIDFLVVKKPRDAKKFYRSPTQSNNLVEFSIITSWKELGEAISKTKGVLNRWFPNKPMEYRRNLSTLVKETVENSIDHSGKHANEGICYYAVQKYEHQDNSVEIQIAVGDVGVGMLTSLRRVYPDTKNDEEAILGALVDGKSGRPTGRGGLGYVTIKDALAKLEGSLKIRSGNALVVYKSCCDSPRICEQKSNYPGTQIIFRCGG